VADQKKEKKRWLFLLLLLLLITILTGLYLFFSSRFEEDKRTREQYVTDSLAQHQKYLDSLEYSKVADSLALFLSQDSLTIEQARLDSLAQEQARLDSLEQVRLDSLQNTPEYRDSVLQEQTRRDSLEREQNRLDSLEQARLDSLRNTPEYRDSVQQEQARRDSLTKEQERIDSLERYHQDSLAQEQARLDSLEKVRSECLDTIAPWIYPEPTGGLHYSPVKVSFISNEPSRIFWKFSEESTFRQWDSSKINIGTDVELHYYAVDSCENVMEPKSKKYVFEQDPSEGHCPQGMTFIENDSAGFCIDKYEWPNREGSSPISNVSLSQASDSCFIAGKRLCTNDEWESACSGKYDWDYPYGQTYEQHACVTLSNRRSRSGDAGECRGWYEVYDMVGNLAEWTSTPSERDSKFYIVKGGFWESGNRGTCSLKRYSYYPQNRHNPVGFRCCKSVEVSQ